jgi:hypothetical protein
MEMGVVDELSGSPEIILEQVQPGSPHRLVYGLPDFACCAAACIELFLWNLEERGMVVLRDYQRMTGRQGIDVQKAENIVVLIDLNTWKFTLDYFAEDTIRH